MAAPSRLMRPNLANRAAVDAAMEAGTAEEDVTRIIDQDRGRRIAHQPEMASAKRFWTRSHACRDCVANSDQHIGEGMVRLLVRDRESIQEAVRRFRKLVERSGLKREMRRREYYEKPSETKRRARLRAERRARNARQNLGIPK